MIVSFASSNHLADSGITIGSVGSVLWRGAGTCYWLTDMPLNRAGIYRLILVIIAIGVSLCLHYYLCVNLLLYITVVTFLKSFLT